MLGAKAQDTAGPMVACLACRAGKRKCDKQLPVCSRCKKLERNCEYQASFPGNVQAQAGQSMPIKLWPISCIRCRAKKRRCDRILPICTRCSRISACCTYRKVNSQNSAADNTDAEIDESLPEKIYILPARTGVFEVPTRYKGYMSHLINFFLTSIVLPSDTVMTSSLAYHLRTQWIDAVMQDPCLFHATLYGASTSIDILQSQQNSTQTLYHQACAIRLIQNRLLPTDPVFSFGTLGAVIVLLYYNIITLDQGTAITHQKGLVQMLLTSPKPTRDHMGHLIAIVKCAMLLFACIYEQTPIWDCLYSESIRPNLLLRGIVSRATLEDNGSIFEPDTMNAILDVYEAVSRLDCFIDGDLNASTELAGWFSFAKTSHSAIRVECDRSITSSQRLNICCRLCCQIFWKLLQHQLYPEKTTSSSVNWETGQLLREFTQIEPLYWIKNAPDVFAWVVSTGSASSNNRAECVAFVRQAGPILTAIDDEDLSLIRRGWRYFCLLKTLRRTRDSFVANYGD